MPSPHTTFGGKLGWVEADRNRSRIRNADIERAILRPVQLVLEFWLDGAIYEVNLQKQATGAFEGTWKRGREPRHEQGPATCTLEPHDDCFPGQLLLVGTWFEDGRWHWTGNLEPLDVGQAAISFPPVVR